MCNGAIGNMYVEELQTTANVHDNVNKNSKQLAVVVEFIKTNIHLTKPNFLQPPPLLDLTLTPNHNLENFQKVDGPIVVVFC